MSEGKGPPYEKPEYCPACGAQSMHVDRFFACDSYWLYRAGQIHQSDRCEVRQLESTVARLRKALEELSDSFFLDGHEYRKIARAALEETK